MFNMDKAVARMDELTQQLIMQLDQVDGDQLIAYMEERNALFAVFENHAWTDADRERHETALRRILETTPLILSRMDERKREAAKQLTQLSTTRRQQESYQPSYEVESLFFDKRR